MLKRSRSCFMDKRVQEFHFRENKMRDEKAVILFNDISSWIEGAYHLTGSKGALAFAKSILVVSEGKSPIKLTL